MLRASSLLVCLVGCAVACNQIFGLEEPRLLDAAAGGDAGAAGAPRQGSGAGGGASGGAADGGSGAGGEGGFGGPLSPVAGAPADAGSGGAPDRPEPVGGSSNELEGGNPATGGTRPAGGAAGAGGAEAPAETGGAPAEPDCEDGERRCAADDEELCDGGRWTSRACAHGCFDDRCADCEPGTLTCTASNAGFRPCDDDGREGAEVACEAGRQCYAPHGCAACAEGSARCSPQTGDAEECDDGDWRLVNECVSQEEKCVVETSGAACIPNAPYALGPNAPLQGGSLEAVAPNLLYAFRLPGVTEAAFVHSLGIVASGEEAWVRLGLYADDGNGRPGQRLLASRNALGIEGLQTLATAELSGNESLVEPGKPYWLVALFYELGSPAVWQRQNGEAPSSFQAPFEFGSLPSAFPEDATEVFTNTEWNLFSMVRTRTP